MICKVDPKTLEYLRKKKLFFSSHGYVKSLREYQELLDPLKHINETKIHPRTQERLNFLSTYLMIDWQYAFKYIVDRKKGTIIYGKAIETDQLITYDRRETTNTLSGQTILHIKGGSLKVSEIINLNYKKFDKRKFNFVQDLFELTKAFYVEQILYLIV